MAALPVPPMEAVRMLLLEDGTAIGGFHRPQRRSLEASCVRASISRPSGLRPTVQCLVLEPSGHCFSFIDAASFSSGSLQRFSSASCPSVHVPLLRSLLSFRNMYAGNRPIYVHHHHAAMTRWRHTDMPTQVRWRCGGFKVAAMRTNDGGYRVSSVDGHAEVTLDSTGTLFEASFPAPVATLTTNPDDTGAHRRLVTTARQRFFRPSIPAAWVYPASVLVAAHQASLTLQPTFDIDVATPYAATTLPVNGAFGARPQWTAVAMHADERLQQTLLAVDVYDIVEHLSVPATSLRRRIVAEWTREASYHVLPHAVMAVVAADMSFVSLAGDIYHHFTPAAEPYEHCFTATTVPPRLSSSYDLSTICRNLARLFESAQHQQRSQEAAPPPAQVVIDCNAVVEDQTTCDGRFRAFGDGRVRVSFADRTILSLDAAGTRGTILLSTGVSVSFLTAAPPDAYLSYITAAVSFQTWAQQSPPERLAASQRQQARAARVDTELAKTQACLGTHRPRSETAADPVQRALAATQAHLERVEKALKRAVD
ncbi:hypothetical protein ACHHYP_03674 [Achlya hypogyna]|uniref:C5orf34-like C-terminal domain-containing protein n=1 Tax=Achlya hypogyna TaxID=1202772 RepID=A0A1V9Z3I9_ACHHY|nr:hypothetical protein ACHHYP_03674 [Achlya hypogyna]